MFCSLFFPVASSVRATNNVESTYRVCWLLCLLWSSSSKDDLSCCYLQAELKTDCDGGVIHNKLERHRHHATVSSSAVLRHGLMMRRNMESICGQVSKYTRTSTACGGNRRGELRRMSCWYTNIQNREQSSRLSRQSEKWGKSWRRRRALESTRSSEFALYRNKRKRAK